MNGIKSSAKHEGHRTGGVKKIVILSTAMLLLASCGRHKMQANGGPVQPGATQYVHLIWKQADHLWKVKLNNGSEQDPSAARTAIGKGTGATMFVVDIAGYPGASFKDSDGLSVWVGSKSTPQKGVNSTQILGPVIAKDGKLVFYDLNQGDAVTLNYQLNFNNAVPSVDPIIDNGGSG